MANDRVIHIGTELDTSGMLAGINKMRQMIGSINVDSNLFKDINKDFDRLTKLALNMGTALKNGIPQKDINGFIKTTEEMSKIYSALPTKIRQVSVEAGNIKFSKEAITRLDEIDVEVEKLNKDIKNAFGSDLREAIRNAVPTNVISNKTLDNILKGKNAIGGFEDELVKTQSAARKTEQDLRQLITTFSSTGNPNQKAFATLLQESLNKGNVSVDTDRLIGFTSDLEGQQSKAIAAINNYNAAREKSIQLEQYYAQIMEIVNNTETTTAQKTEQVAKLVQERQEITNKTVQESLHLREEAANVAEQTSNKEVNGLKKVGESAENTNNHIQRQDSLLRQLAARATSLIGIGAMFNYITRGVRDAWNGIKDLDKEFTQIAVVTDKTTSQLWQSFGTYSQMAQRLGVATKDAVATSALYYQQGLDTADVMTLTAETIKMAQIAGMDFATATNQMTAAIRGFNLEMNQASMVNDIFSTLAAHAAVSTQELSYALTKTASIAESAGMSIDTTSAFLTKMIETTREAPENIGTAMKSIVARFEELKKNPLALSVEVEGEEVVANKVEAAIALAGVRLRDETTKQFRDLDDVFLELAKSWDGLDRNTQRYIATIAAGSRQQSRFIALMDGYDRTLELTQIAQDSEGQSAAQFLKTLDSMESKLARVGNSLEQLYQKFVSSEFFGGLLDGLNNLLQSLGNFNAGELANFAIIGTLMVNTIINSLKTGIPAMTQIGNTIGNHLGEKISNGINNKLSDTKFGKIASYFTSSHATKKAEDKFNLSAEKQKNKLQEKYNIEVDVEKKKADVKIKDLEKELNNLKAQKTQAEIDVSITGSDDSKAELNNLNNLIEEKVQEKTNIEGNLQESLGNLKQDLDTAFTEVDETAKEKSKAVGEGISKNLGAAMTAAGTSAAMALATAITTAFSGGDAGQVLLTGLSTLAMSFAPQAIAIFSAAAGPAMAAEGLSLGQKLGAGINAGMAAMGPALIIAAIGAALVGLVALISWAASKNKTESQKLQEELEDLKNKQKELQETSERSTAEAAVQKTSYKNIKNLKEEYIELSEKSGRTVEDNERLAQITEEIEKDFPELVDRYDEAGNAVLKQKEAWEEIVELQKESAKEAAKQAFADKIDLSNNRIKIAETTQKAKEATNAERLRKLEGKSDNQHLTDVNSGLGLSLLLGPLAIAGAAATLISTTVQASTGRYDRIDAEDTKRISSKANYEQYLKDSGYQQDDKGKFIGLDETRQKILDSFDDEESKKNQKEIAEAIKEQETIISEYMVNYIKTFSDEDDVLGEYSDDTLKTYAQSMAKDITQKQEYTMEAVFGSIGDATALFDKLVSNRVLTDAEAYTKMKNSSYVGNINKAIQDAQDGVVDWKNTGLNDDEIIEFEKWTNELIQVTMDEKIKAATEELKQVIADMKANGQEEELDILNNMGAYGNAQVEQIYSQATEQQQNVFKQGKEIYDQKVAELEEFGEGQLKPVIERYGTDLAEYIKQQDLGKAATEAVVDSLNDLSLSGGEAKGLITLVSSIDDWADPEQIKRLSEEIYKLTGNTKETINTVMNLRDQFLNPIMLQLDADQAVADMSSIAKSLNEMKKGFKDLKSAMDEFKENGRLSGETILDLVENGQLLYLEYDKETKAVTINKNAMEDYFKAQVAMNKYNLLQKKQDALEAIAELEAKRDNLKQKRKILVEAYENEGKLTGEQYDQLYKLNEHFQDDTLAIAKAIEDGTINAAADTFTKLEGITASGIGGILQTIKNNGPKIAEALTNAMSGNFEKIDTSTIFNAETSKKNIDDFLNSYKNRDITGYRKADTYTYDTETLKKYIEQLDTDIEGTEKLLKAKQEYYKLLEKGEGIYDAITESGLDKFMSDTAKATKDANKELKDYVSTLEKYYNISKRIEKLSEATGKAKKQWQKTGSEEDKNAYQNALYSEAKERAQDRANYRGERDLDIKELQAVVAKYGIKAEDIKLDANGFLDMEHLRPILESMAESGELNAETGEKLESIISDKMGEIEDDTSHIDDTDKWFEETIEDLESSNEKLEEIKNSIDRLRNMEQALDSIKKTVDDAKNLNEDYYESGGKEGISGMEYLKVVGESIKSYGISNKAYADDQAKQRQEIEQKYGGALTLGADNKYYINQSYYDGLDLNNEVSAEELNKIEEVANKYNELTDKIQENTDARRDSIKGLKAWAKNLRQSYSNIVNRVAEAMATLDQREIDEVKKKYAMIQEEDDKYLDALQKSIDKQRQLRDQANSYDDLEKDEKRLALLERDTSGANAAEIAALKEQIKDARQNLVDTEQDNIVNGISDENEARKNKMNEETEFLQNVMDERTFDMQYYITKAQDLVNAAIEGDAGAYQRMLGILQEAEDSFFKATAEAKEMWMEDLTKEFTEGSDWRKVVLGGMQAIATGTIAEIDNVVKNFIETENQYNTELSNKIENLDEQLNMLDLETAFTKGTEAVEKMKLEIEELIKTMDAIPNVERTITYKAVYEGDGNGSGNGNGGKGNGDNPEPTKAWKVVYDDDNRVMGEYASEAEAQQAIVRQSLSNHDFAAKLHIENPEGEESYHHDDFIIANKPKVKNEETEKSALTETEYNSRYNSEDDYLDPDLLQGVGPYYVTPDGSVYDKVPSSVDYSKYWGEEQVEELKKTIRGSDRKYYKKFAKGGLVNYTGPAWVDGTPAKPEAFLSVDDTRNIQALTEILSDILSPISSVSGSEKSEVKSGDTNIEIHIEVEQISDDYDVDQMLDTIQQRISEASEGNVTIVK